jgi:hypothetical protein
MHDEMSARVRCALRNFWPRSFSSSGIFSMVSLVLNAYDIAVPRRDDL